MLRENVKDFVFHDLKRLRGKQAADDSADAETVVKIVDILWSRGFTLAQDQPGGL